MNEAWFCIYTKLLIFVGSKWLANQKEKKIALLRYWMIKKSSLSWPAKGFILILAHLIYLFPSPFEQYHFILMDCDLALSGQGKLCWINIKIIKRWKKYLFRISIWRWNIKRMWCISCQNYIVSNKVFNTEIYVHCTTSNDMSITC